MKEKRKNEKTFHVSVIGGGIAGMAVAFGLQQAGIHFDIFERAGESFCEEIQSSDINNCQRYPLFGDRIAESAELGAGLGLGRNARVALSKLGYKVCAEHRYDEIHA